MLLFIYEYTCASACWASLPESLRAEGKAMLSALLDDFAVIDNVTTCTLLAPAFQGAMAHQDCRHRGDEKTAFWRLAEQADFSLIIAPEFDDLLTARCQWVAEAGGRSLNCSLDAIRLTADKLTLAEYLCERSVPTPTVRRFGTPEANAVRLAETDFPGVLKPRWGAGCQSTFLLNDLAELIPFYSDIRRATHEELVFTSYIKGLPVSVSFLAGPNQRLALPPAIQEIESAPAASEQPGCGARLTYRGGRVPGSSAAAAAQQPGCRRRAVDLACRAVDTIEGLRGWVGVDLILGGAADGSEDHVIEINPRLTTSYVGLRRLCKTNLAEALLQIANGDEVNLEWFDKSIRFDATGKCN